MLNSIFVFGVIIYPVCSGIAGNNSNIVYVQNWVSEILSLKEQLKLRFYHVRSKENPADLLSRGS